MYDLFYCVILQLNISLVVKPEMANDNNSVIDIYWKWLV